MHAQIAARRAGRLDGGFIAAAESEPSSAIVTVPNCITSSTLTDAALVLPARIGTWRHVGPSAVGALAALAGKVRS